MKHPIERIEWKSPQDLDANNYNPNFVIEKEMKLLEFSIRSSGWVQPVIIDKKNVIIDGFHRTTIARINGWKVPCVVMEMSEPERMMFTIRINRAKGTHNALKMSDIIKKLVELGTPIQKICEGIGADKSEVELLMMTDIFEKHDIPNHKYSRAWYPL